MSPMYHEPIPQAHSLQLPRTLQRPQSMPPVSPATIAAIDPRLAGVPLEFVRSGLQDRARKMAASCSQVPALPPTIPCSRLPPSLTIPVPATEFSPTHLLALSSSASKASTISTLPTHDLILAAYCAALPALPPRAGAGSGQLTLPVVPLSVPSADAFPALHRYLYSKNSTELLATLTNLPVDTVAQGSSTGGRAHAAHELARRAGGDPQRLMVVAQRANGFWRNACALGMFEREMWDTLDLAWEIILGALNVAVKARQ